MYTLKGVFSLVFFTMMFAHKGEIFTLDQLIYYEPKPHTNINTNFHVIEDIQHLPYYIDMDPCIFKKCSLLRAYHGAPSQGNDANLM
jgi:hypothetical protein